MIKNATTGFAPSELLCEFRPSVRKEFKLQNNERKRFIGKLAKKRNDLMSKKIKEQLDKSIIEKYTIGDLALGEHVKIVPGLYSEKLVPKYIGPVRATEVLGNDRFNFQKITA